MITNYTGLNATTIDRVTFDDEITAAFNRVKCDDEMTAEQSAYYMKLIESGQPVPIKDFERISKEYSQIVEKFKRGLDDGSIQLS